MSVTRPIYLDNAASTPLDPRVADCMAECLRDPDLQANPSSSHSLGARARQAIETARAAVARLIDAPPECLVFTGCATESNNLALLGLARAARGASRRLLSSRLEHKSVLDTLKQLEREGCALDWMQTDRQGRIDPVQLATALRPDTVLVSVMHVNNETGVVQDIAAIGAAARARGVPLHVDAAQSGGKLDCRVAVLGADLLSLAAHKMHGPKGIGALYVRAEWRARLQPVLFGGGQERGLRSGTLATHQIVGFGKAAALAQENRVAEQTRIGALREQLWAGLADLPGVVQNGHPTERVAGILNISIDGVQGEALRASLPELAFSTGAACDASSGEPSYVLRALGRDGELAHSSLRLSLGRFSTEVEVQQSVVLIRAAIMRLRALAP